MEGVISVIVPVYNVEKYLRQSLDSILLQTYARLQILVIDDGSTDASGAICEEYAAKDPRITVIHKENGGAASARNVGLRMAVGEYLSFVDSDDYLEPDAYAYMISALQEQNADAIQCARRDVFLNFAVDQASPRCREVLTAQQFLLQFTQDWTCGLLWDKLYKRCLFDGVFFEEGHRLDDEYVTYQGLMNAKAIVKDGHIVYNYRKRRSGIMLSPESGKQILLDRVDYLSKRRIRVIARFPALRRAFDRNYLEMLVYLSREPGNTGETLQVIRSHLRDYFREKGHAGADIRLWPALIRLQLGLTVPKKPEQPSAQAHQEAYFE